MITTSENANPNYLCKVVRLKNLKKHGNADRLQTVSIDFQTVITGMDAKEGDLYVYFPLESKINSDFLAFTNSFRDATLNKNPEEKGFFEDNCRVKATRLRGEKSMGYIVPANVVSAWANFGIHDSDEGIYFDTIGGLKLVEKYQVKQKISNQSNKQGTVSRLIEGQVHLHVDTENLRKSVHQINPEDLISITYKTHGTSWWVSNVLVKRKLSLTEKIAKLFGAKIQETEYDYVYGSRKVVKNSSLEDTKAKDHFYGYDLWEKVKDEVKSVIPKGFTLYGEMIGFDHNGGEVQKGYDYGCKPAEHKLEVYRITQTTPDGLVTELTQPQIEQFCEVTGLTSSTRFFYGKAKEYLPEGKVLDIQSWRERLIQKLEEEFNDKDCFMCNNVVPEEGVVVRKDSLLAFNAFKLKSFRFLEFETKQLDSGISDLESEN